MTGCKALVRCNLRPVTSRMKDILFRGKHHPGSRRRRQGICKNEGNLNRSISQSYLILRYKQAYLAQGLEDDSANEPQDTQYQLIKRYPGQLEEQIQQSAARQASMRSGPGGDATNSAYNGNKARPGPQPLGIAGAIVTYVTEKIADFINVPADQPADGEFKR